MPRFAVRLASALAALLAAAPAAFAQPAPIDFAEYRSGATTAYQATPGGDVYTDGFAFTTGSNALTTWGTDPADPFNASLPSNLGPTAAAMSPDQFGEAIDLYAWSDPATDVGVSPTRFNLYSIQAGHKYASSYLTTPPGGGAASLLPISFVVFGWTTPTGAGSSSLSAAFTLPAPTRVGGVQTPLLYDIVLPAEWRGLTRARFYNGSYNLTTGDVESGSAVSVQFTNVRAEIIPEPATFLLVGVGTMLVVTVRRRTRTA
jgi:hypothetical protein